MKHTSMSDDEYKLLSAIIEKRTGISLGSEKKYLLEARFPPLLAEFHAHSYLELSHKISRDHSNHMTDVLAEAITTNETSWFRDGAPFAVFEKEVVPEILKSLDESGRKIRLWSAACSTGQEPYSMAMACLEASERANVEPNFEIIATDLSPGSLSKASSGKYDKRDMERGMPGHLVDKYMTHSHGMFQPSPEVRSMIKFGRQNLQEDFAPLGMFDVVFVRNVTIYFSGGLKRDILERVAKSIRPGGFLFLGASESMGDVDRLFRMVHSHGAIYFRRTEAF